MVREGYWFGLPPLVIGLIVLPFGSGWVLAIGIVFVLLGLFVFSFFRDPDRSIPTERGLIVAPADGRVVVVKEESQRGRAGKRISIFLAIWNVHVNRAPASGRIERMDYRRGKFYAAMRSRASVENEQNVIYLATERGEIMFKQIAGWVARRVVCWKRPAETVRMGERFGLIRFGSRMDLWLPEGVEILVAPGQHVSGGSSIVARWK